MSMKIDENKRKAIYTTLVLTRDHYKSDPIFMSTIRSKCVLEHYGSKLPFHVILGGSVTKEHLKVYKHFNITVEDHRKDEDFLKGIWNPLYRKSDASKGNTSRIFDHDYNLQGRRDGWATYFKFFVWKKKQ